VKQQIRILGIDDAPFVFSDTHTIIIGVVMRGGSYLEGVLSKQLTIDGSDATRLCEDMIQQTKHRQQLRAAMIDGVALGGFNIVDIDRVYETTKLPILTITRDKPDLEKMKQALRHHFNDWEERWHIITRGELHQVQTKHNPLYMKCVGLSVNDAKEIINLSTIRGVIPEPIRVAHIIASGVKRGESYGKA